MSWRIVILPHPDLPDDAIAEDTWADWIIPIGATDAQVDEVAKKANWQLPLQISTPSEADSRYRRLLFSLDEEHCMSDEDFSTIIRPGLLEVSKQ